MLSVALWPTLASLVQVELWSSLFPWRSCASTGNLAAASVSLQTADVLQNSDPQALDSRRTPSVLPTFEQTSEAQTIHHL